MNHKIYDKEVCPTRAQIEDILWNCYCKKRTIQGKTIKTPTPVPEGTHEMVYLDFKKTGGNGKKYLSIAEPLSGSYWPLEVENETADELIKKMSIFLTVYGHVRAITADNGSAFISKEFRKFCRDLRIRLKYTAVYNQKANRAERPHSMVNKANLLNLEIKGKKLSRTQMVEFAWCQNLLPKKRTGHAPVEVIFGGFPKGIFEDPDEEELSTGDQNPIADKVSTELTTKAYKGMIEQEEKKGEVRAHAR